MFDFPIYILIVRQAVSDNVTKIFELFYITYAVITNFSGGKVWETIMLRLFGVKTIATISCMLIVISI